MAANRPPAPTLSALTRLKGITDLDEPLTLSQQIKRSWQTTFQNFLKVGIGCVAARNLQDLWRRAQSIQQHEKVTVLCHNYSLGVSGCLEDLAVLRAKEA